MDSLICTPMFYLVWLTSPLSRQWCSSAFILWTGGVHQRWQSPLSTAISPSGQGFVDVQRSKTGILIGLLSDLAVRIIKASSADPQLSGRRFLGRFSTKPGRLGKMPD